MTLATDRQYRWRSSEMDCQHCIVSLELFFFYSDITACKSLQSLHHFFTTSMQEIVKSLAHFIQSLCYTQVATGRFIMKFCTSRTLFLDASICNHFCDPTSFSKTLKTSSSTVPLVPIWLYGRVKNATSCLFGLLWSVFHCFINLNTRSSFWSLCEFSGHQYHHHSFIIIIHHLELQPPTQITIFLFYALSSVLTEINIVSTKFLRVQKNNNK